MANITLTKLLNSADTLAKRNIARMQLSVLQNYKTALDEIKNKIALIYEKYGNFSDVELRKFNRLVSLEKQITDDIKNLTGITINSTGQNIKDSFKTSFTLTTGAIETATELNFGFNMLPKESIKYAMQDNLWLDLLKNHNAKLLTDIKMELENTLRTNARQEIVSGLAQGKPYSQVAKAITERFNVAATRAKTIAFTEMHKAQSKGRLEGITRAEEAAKGLGIKTKKLWRHNHVGIPRPKHLALDGVPAKDGVWNVNGVIMSAPGVVVGGSGNIPGEIINCHCSALFMVEGLG